MSFDPEKNFTDQPIFFKPMEYSIFGEKYRNSPEDVHWPVPDPDLETKPSESGRHCEAHHLATFFVGKLGGSGLYEEELLNGSPWTSVRYEKPYRFTEDSKWPRTQSHWRSGQIYALRQDRIAKPHIASFLLDSTEADDEHPLLRSELCLGTDIIAMHMRLSAFLDEKVFPALVFSVCARSVRILQFHFDGERLVVRKTPYLNFDEYNEDNVKAILRWGPNYPCGDTDVMPPAMAIKFQELQRDEKQQDETKKYANGNVPQHTPEASTKSELGGTPIDTDTKDVQATLMVDATASRNRTVLGSISGNVVTVPTSELIHQSKEALIQMLTAERAQQAKHIARLEAYETLLTEHSIPIDFVLLSKPASGEMLIRNTGKATPARHS
ncbi:hypothetical protein EV356DRAFT_534134 [Viridothelium virens]|uniref:Uncharacterized protein n=1 Tax=Viridothelium virens TaxID=1048519 RepID=A0A6A6H4K3_VIRVR|nr:hypothetical protein EV356DRAFT_534134 [Viridothelium virens]